MAEETKKPKSTEERLLKAATREFSDYGLAGARVDRIAATAGVNKAMLYYHFGSKEKLYREVIGSHLAKVVRAVGDLLSSFDTLEDALQSLARAYAAMFSSSPDFVPLALRELASGGHHMRAAVEQVFSPAQIPQRLKSLIEEGIAEGRYRDVDPVHAVISFVGMNLHYLILAPVVHSLWGIKDEEQFRRDRSEQVVDLFLHGLLAR